MIWVLTALYWVYNADEGNSLEDEKLTQSNLDTLLWLALPPWKILLEHTLKAGENLGAFITMKDQETPQIKEESFKIKKHHSKNQAQSGNRSKYVWARKHVIATAESEGTPNWPDGICHDDLIFQPRELSEPKTLEVHLMEPWSTSKAL